MANEHMGNDPERRILKTEAAGHSPEENLDNPPFRNEEIAFEPSDIDARHTFITGISLLIGLWVVIALVFFVFAYLAHELALSSPPPLPIAAHGSPMPPEPRLQPSPSKDLKKLRAREDWELNHYFWADKAKGRVAIPIERAMDILATRGIPPQKQPPNLVLSQPEAGTRQTGFEGKVAPEPQ